MTKVQMFKIYKPPGEEIMDPQQNNDRELVRDFIVFAAQAQKMLLIFTINIDKMQAVNKALLEQRGSEQEQSKYTDYSQLTISVIELTEEMNKLLKLNSTCQKDIKQHLQAMQADYNEAKQQFPKEPETRVKNTVHQAMAAEFKSLIQQAQTSQTNFKDTVKNRLKRLLGFYKKDATDDQLDEMVRDPEAAKKLMQEQVVGTAHSKV